MPKISGTGEPSYAGHEGTVTNAVGEQFDVNPTVDLDGERKDGYKSEPIDESFEPTPAPGTAGPVAPIDESDDNDGDENGERDGRDAGGRDNDQRPRLVDHRQSETGPGDKSRESTTAAKKAAPGSTKR